MAEDTKNQFEVINENGTNFRRTVAHLPAYLRTDANSRFLSSTLDALIQPGDLTRLDGYIGKDHAYTRNANDTYVPAINQDRKNYQLEPTVTYSNYEDVSVNPDQAVEFTATYDDYINQIKYFGGFTNDHNRLNKSKVYNWNPAVDYDKLVNYRDYYWLPEGPDSIPVSASGPLAVVDIDVKNNGSGAYEFSTRYGESNPAIKLHKGNTYNFNVNSPGHPFYIMTEPFTTGISSDGSTSVVYSDGVSGNGTSVGTVTFTVPENAPDVLYYQCGSHAAMQGIIQISAITESSKIDVANEILGSKNYKTSKGVQLSDGMKIRFEDNVTDTTNYSGKEFYVEGVGDEITLTNVEDLVPTGSYTTEVGENYDEVAYSSRPYAISFFRADTPDYITIKRDSADGNSWSAYNRWFHKSVIEKTAEANKNTPVLQETDRAKRPIIEFDSGLNLFDHGRIAKKSVTLVDTVSTDVFTEMVRKTGYIVDGVAVKDGMRILIINDKDPLVKNKIYKINFVTVAGETVTTLRLSEDSDTNPVDGEVVRVEYGRDNQGKSYYYDADTKTWKTGQNKTSVNQAPLFKIFDENHIEYDDAVTYPNSSFSGAKLFSYATSTTAPKDKVLGINVKYKNINSVGDILFESDYVTDSFSYNEGNVRKQKKFNVGHFHLTNKNQLKVNRSSWVERTSQSKQYVIDTFVATADELLLFPVRGYDDSTALTDLEVHVTVNGQHNDDYTLVSGSVHKFVKFNKKVKVDDIVVIKAYSNRPKSVTHGFYEVPEALAINPLNEDLSQFTYGELVNIVKEIVQKSTDVTGTVPGTTNLRDVPSARNNAGTAIQHTASIVPAMFLLIDKDANFMSALDYTAQEYLTFKEKFITHVDGKTYEGSAVDRVDEIILSLTGEKNNSFAFFYEDMVGFGENVSVRNYTVMDPSITEYAIDSKFNDTEVSNRAVYVYLNDVQLYKDIDYVFSKTDDSIEIKKSLNTADKIRIKDYKDTVGSFIPPTPTKLGIYPKFKPEIISDDTYQTTQSVIVGHDGSRTKAYGDYRDDLILELEKRIYNNCKTAYDPELLSETEIRPSVFKDTDYKLNEVNSILEADFFSWAGRYGIDHSTNSVYDISNEFTYNYSNSKDKFGNRLPGYWRAIYKMYYDTDRPHQTPWEMIGYSEKPTWWEDQYGPAPYTSGNDLLWTDMSNGFDRGTSKTNSRFIRTGLKQYLPVNEYGALKSPLDIGLIDEYDSNTFGRKWNFGDQSPSETAWRRSSSYPFSVMRLLSLTRPSKFFGVFFNNDALKKDLTGNYIDKNTGVIQKLSTAKYHLELVDGVRHQSAGYQPFIINFLIEKGIDPARYFYDKVKNLQINLAYKLGGFTDKNNLRILTDSVSPGSTAGSQVMPNENYKIIFRSSNPVQTFSYSGVLIELNSAVTNDGSTLEGGYKIIGYDRLQPYFNVLEPIKNSNSFKIKEEQEEILLYKQYGNKVKKIAYNTVFKTKQEVVDFLLGYEKYLESQGFVFDHFSKELGEIANWTTSVKEFFYWSRQGWETGSAITLSPGAERFRIKTQNSIINKLQDVKGNYTVLDSNGERISKRLISTKRVGSTFDIVCDDTEIGIYGFKADAIQKEHILIFDNKTVFSDVVYSPASGYRQNRLKLIGWKTANWNGDYFSPGFIFDTAKVVAWTRNTDFQVGDTVEYDAKYYVAKTNHNSGASFTENYWSKKDNKPESRLIPNFDYKISQFNDFYSLESNNFDESQERLAQKLVGYQGRDYLNDLFNNEISQFKFYQGYIREKGTVSAINKFTKGKFLGQNTDVEIYPEWMIKSGEFGNTEGLKGIQLVLRSSEFTNNKQSIELVNSDLTNADWSKSIKISQEKFYSKPLEYTAESTFDLYDYTAENTDRDSVQKYKTAGYVKLSDVQHTAFFEDDLLNLQVANIDGNDLIWIASKKNKDWDVYRVTNAKLKILSFTAINENTQLRLVLNDTHNLVKDQFILIRDAEEQKLNKVVKVAKIHNSTTIDIDFENSNEISTTAVFLDDSTEETHGNIAVFKSVRFADMDDVNSDLSYDDYQKTNTTLKTPGDKIFIDSIDGKWSVFEKIDPYTKKIINPPGESGDNKEFGHRIVARNDGRTLVASAPKSGQGTINFFARRTNSPDSIFFLQQSHTITAGSDNTSQLGHSLAISTDENFVMAGAPYANITASDGSTLHNDAGLVQIYKYDDADKKYTATQYLTANVPNDGSTVPDNSNFGYSVAMSETSNSSLTGDKYLFVGAPGHDNDSGTVYVYSWGIGADGSTYDTWNLIANINTESDSTANRFGENIKVNSAGDIIAISSKAPGNAGKVEIFTRSSDSFTHRQTITGVGADGSTLDTEFAKNIDMSKDGSVLVIAAEGYDGADQTNAGAVYVYKWKTDGSTLEYTLDQTLSAPESDAGMRFGSSVSIDTPGKRIIVGAKEYSTRLPMQFDFGATTFDGELTSLSTVYEGSGGVFTFTKYDTKYLLDDKLITTTLSANDEFGNGVFNNDSSIFVGSPLDDTNAGGISNTNDGSVTVFDLTTENVYAWKNIATEENFVDNTKITSGFIFNSSTNQIKDYLNYFDPVKGRILGQADVEIDYKTEWDPAIYNVGSTDQNVDGQTAWGDEHVGQVWWDLSKVKWIWYEQGTQEYRTNNWGSTFPGSVIDIYEWVESIYPPSEYLRLSQGEGTTLSGTPINTDNSYYTVKQKYSENGNKFVNYYYYWVKNKATLPPVNASTARRTNPVSYIANIIENPFGTAQKYFAITGKNKLVVFNSKSMIEADNIVLNLNYRKTNNENDPHVVWRIVKEGDVTDTIPSTIENKWWDSLIGADIKGNTLPDLSLPISERYGNLKRPRQSWYVNRYNALQELIEYVNSILVKEQFSNEVSFDTLNSEDPAPTKDSLRWDQEVPTYADLTYINTRDISGILNVLVRNDEENSNNKWAIYQWNTDSWTRTVVQTYKTNNFWEYIDWYKQSGSMIHSADTVIDKQINYTYELDQLEMQNGKHVKVLNSDTGGWKIYMKTDDGWENVATEKGTIKIKSSLYDYGLNNFGFAGTDSFDINTFDEEPQKETRQILTALKNDIFINENQKEYKNLFFIGIRKVLNEQLYVDWLYKTSFISVKNKLRELDQKKTYNTSTDTYLEEYINEVKPFHTKVREFKLGYDSKDTQDNIITDFDSPQFWDGTKIRNLNLLTDVDKLEQYPWKFFADNYKFNVKEIKVYDGGSGYTTAPDVTLTGGTTKAVGPFAVLGRSTFGDTNGDYGYFYPLYTSKVSAELSDKRNGGSGTANTYRFVEFPGLDFYMPNALTNNAVSSQPTNYEIYQTTDVNQATAKAVISGGKVSKILIVTNGSNYTTAPNVVITGGGPDGTTPTDTARARAVLSNSMVRNISTTIKFDRIKKEATVYEWASGTSYSVGDLVRNDNKFYKVKTAHTSGAKFRTDEDNFTKLRGDESEITAAERTLGLYAPKDGMPGVELNQVMSGIDYGGVMVTGLDFDESKGWDRSAWYELPWDNYGNTSNVTFYGDGSTTQFTLDTAPLSTDVYTVYFTDTSDSTSFNNTNKTRQVKTVIRGDGSNRTFTIVGDNGSPASATTMIELIRFDDDGVLTPTDDRTLDTVLSGGLFKSVLGQAPTDINLEGDAFVTPETSFSPEENLPGSIFDTVDIKVYTAPTSGVPFVVNKVYTGNGTTTTFNIGQMPGTQNSVFVTVNNVQQRITDEFTVDVSARTITLASAPQQGDVIAIKSFGVSGTNYMVLDELFGDGSTTSFLTKSRDTYQLDSTTSQIYVTIDGVKSTSFTTSSVNKRIQVVFDSAPATGACIQVSSYNRSSSLGRSQAEIRTEVLTYDGSTNRYELTYPAGSVAPFSGLTIVELDGKVLRGPDNTYFIGDGSTTAFSYGDFAGATVSATPSAYTDVVEGDKTDIGITQSVIDEWATDLLDSAWYLSITNNESANELATVKHSVLHNDSDAFISTSNIVQSGTASHMTADADINAGKVRLLGTGVDALNSTSYYRIGLGDNTSASESGPIKVGEFTSVDSSSAETFDTFATSTRGAKYFISARDTSTGQVTNTEAVVVHDNTTAYVSQYNTISTSGTDLVTITTNLASGTVSVNAQSSSANVNIKFYRIGLSDNEVTDGEKLLNTQTIDSATTTLDSFTTSEYFGAHYVVTTTNTDTNKSTISELTLIIDAATSYLAEGPMLSSDDSALVTFTGEMDGNTVILNGSSNSGPNTKVSIYRIGLIRTAAGSVINPEKINVFVNGARKTYLSDYTVNTATGFVNLLTAPSVDDVVAISTLSGNHYSEGNDDIVFDPTQITDDGHTLTAGSTISITTFNNALGSKARREIFAGKANSATTGRTAVFSLDEKPLNSDYVFVWHNGVALISGVDFKLSVTELEYNIEIYGRVIQNSDRFDVMYFATTTDTNANGFRIFKDMLNRTFYKRISSSHSTKLAQVLKSTDDTITVEDAGKLAEVDGSTAEPGIILIGNERIEYFIRNGNVLSQLRRGTLGTAINSEYAGGTPVVDMGNAQTIPYADTVYTKTYTGDGATNTFATRFAATTAEELDVFVGGVRLAPRNADSTANYTVDGSTTNVVLLTTPADKVQVKIIQKRGAVWYDAGSSQASDGKGLNNAKTPQARFIAGEPTNAPE